MGWDVTLVTTIADGFEEHFGSTIQVIILD